MKLNINELLNYFLYNVVKENTNDKYDLNIYKSLETLFKNNDINDDFLIDKIKSSLAVINVNYDWKSNEYYNDFFKKSNQLNYYGSSLSDNTHGLERSQLKSLTAVINNINKNNHYIAINGAPGTGKSTLLNNVISNLLINSLLEQYKENSNLSFLNFLKNKYIPCSILLTGLTKNAVINVSDICTIKFENENIKHKWIKTSNKKLEEIFNSLDINFSIEFKNEQDKTKRKIDIIKQEYLLDNISKYKQELKTNYINNFYKYFDIKDFQWNDIPDYLFNKLNNNIKIIKNINSTIKGVFKESIVAKINNFINQISFQNIIYNLSKLLVIYKKNKSQRESILADLLKEFDDLIYFAKDTLKINFINLFKPIFNFVNKYEKFKHKYKKVFSKLKKCIKVIFKYWKRTFDFNDINNYFINLNKSLKTIANIFNKQELEDLLFDTNIEFSSNINDEQLVKLIKTLDIVKINFNNIQQKLDTSYRNENIFIYRHICEWLFINNLNKDCRLSDFRIIKPIISSNLQSFNLSNVQEIWNDKPLQINSFDYVIIDEASQASWKYAPFLLYCFKNIIAVGDEKQLPPMDINELTTKCFNSLKDKSFDDEYFNKFKEDSDFNKTLDKLKQLLKATNLFNLDNKSYINESVLNWINKTFNIFSELKLSLSDSNSLTEEKGLFLLEHFRCPQQIFNAFNYSFYDGTLEYSKDIAQYACSFSKHSELLCSETTFIQLKYEFKDEMYKNNCNLEEIKIALNFIIDNLEYFLEHDDRSINNMNQKAIDYLSKNVLFVSFYKDQKDKINSILKDIVSYLDKYLSNSNNEFYIEYQNNEKNISYSIFNKIKSTYNKQQIDWINKFLKKLNCGTIDSTQGLGVDFVIMSNVSKTIFHEEKHYFRKFENDSKRINVFLSRTKKHFIQIISNNYWDDFNKINLDKIDEKSKKGVQCRRLVEVLIDDKSNKIIFDINWKRLNNNLSIQNLWNTYKYKGDIEQLKNKSNHIGKYGETTFNYLATDPLFAKLLSKKMNDQLGMGINFLNNINWVNKDYESKKQFDFIIDDNYYTDIKSTISNNDIVYMSNLEFKFAMNNSEKYFITKINDISKFNLNIRNKSSLAFIFNKISFYKFDNKKLKNKSTSIKYRIRT